MVDGVRRVSMEGIVYLLVYKLHPILLTYIIFTDIILV